MAGPRRPQIATDTVCRIVIKARQFDVKEAEADPDEGSNAVDDGFTDVLEDTADDPVYEELTTGANGLRRSRSPKTNTPNVPRPICSARHCSPTCCRKAWRITT